MDIVLETAVKYNDIFMAGAKITIIISFLSCFFGLFLGVILAFMKISGVKILQAVAAVYVEVIRGTPVLVQISLVFFGLPFLGIQFPNFEIWGVDFERLSAGVLALILNSGAYKCEIVRFPPLVIVAVYYFVMTFFVSSCLRVLEIRLKVRSVR